MGLLNLISRVFGGGPMSPINEVLPNNAPNGFKYDVVYIPGAAQGNALRNRAEQEAALAQTQQEHNDALNTYLAAMNYPPAVRKRMGKVMEKNLPKWNPAKDRKPRRPLTPSSSAISEIKINPDNTIGIRYGNSRSYTFRGANNIQDAAKEVLELINSSSLGRELNTRIPGTWGNRHRI